MSIQAITALGAEIEALRSDLSALTTTVGALQDRLAATEVRTQATERALTHKRAPGRWATWTDDDLGAIHDHLATYGPQLYRAMVRHYGRAMIEDAVDREFVFASFRNGTKMLSATPAPSGTGARAVINYLTRNGPTWRSARPAGRATLAEHFDKNRVHAHLTEALATGEIVKGIGASTGGRPPQIYAIRPSTQDPDLPAVVDGVPVTWQL